MELVGDIRKRRGVACYHQLYVLLSMALNEGAIAAGDALPTETKLMERFGVSRNTVRRALGQLEEEKRIVRRRGSGSYARKVGVADFPFESVVSTPKDTPKSQTSSRLLRIRMAATPEFIRRRDPQFSEKSLLVQRGRSYKDIPFMLCTSHVPEALGSRLSRRQLARQSVLHALDELGIAPATAEQTITAALADAVTARFLGLEAAATVLCVYRLVRDAAGRAIEHQNLAFRPDRFWLRSNLVIERSAAGLTWADTQSALVPASA